MRTILLVALLLTSCTKFGKNISVKGRVLNPVTGEGFAGCELRLLKSEVFAVPGGYKLVKSVKTVEDGSFELNKLSFRAEILRASDLNGDYHRIGWTSDNGQTFYPSNYDLVITKGKKQQADYWAVPYGCIQYHIKNINCLNANDTMWYRRKYMFDNDFIDLWSFPVVGCADLQAPDCEKLPMGNHIFQLKVKRNGVLTYSYDTIFVNATGVSPAQLFY